MAVCTDIAWPYWYYACRWCLNSGLQLDNKAENAFLYIQIVMYVTIAIRFIYSSVMAMVKCKSV